MIQTDQRPSDMLLRLANGYQVSQAIHVAATLGIADLLKAGPRDSDELAEETGTHTGSLYRLLRALASIGVFREESERRFRLTPLGEYLCSDGPESVAPWASFIGRPHHWQAWEHLSESVRTGENAARLAHGTSSWEYRALHPEEGAIFDAAMTGLSRRQAVAVLAAFDFGPSRCIVDVAGGQGWLLAAILAANPATRGVLFDQPHVIAHAEPILKAAGVAERCQLVGGSFFDSVPEGGDTYVLKQILHDWEDEPAVAILRACRRAMGGATRLLVIERLIDPLKPSAEAAFADLNMLVGPGGQERTAEEFAALFARAGFRLTGIHAAASVSIIESRPV